MSGGKPRGLNAARKLRNNRREQRWSDLSYKKRALGTAFKSRCAANAGILDENRGSRLTWRIARSVVRPTPRESSLRRSASKPSSPTPYVNYPDESPRFRLPYRFISGPRQLSADTVGQAIRKCVRVQLIKNGKKVTAFGTASHSTRWRSWRVVYENYG